MFEYTFNRCPAVHKTTVGSIVTRLKTHAAGALLFFRAFKIINLDHNC